MGRNSFNVVYYKRKIVYLSVGLMVMQGFLISTAYGSVANLELPWKIFDFTFIPGIMFYFIITRLLAYIKVDGRLIRVRTKFGRKYHFSCREINKIACFTDHNPKHGVSHDICMKVDMDGKQVDTYVFSSMKGFSTMAAYLLEMHERGEIKEEAISKSCKKMLTKYKNLEDKK